MLSIANLLSIQSVSSGPEQDRKNWYAAEGEKWIFKLIKWVCKKDKKESSPLL